MTERRADTIAAAAVALCVITAAAGSAIQRDLFHAGRPTRWAALLLLGGVAAWRAWRGRRTWQLRPVPAAVVGLFCALCLVSAGWSAVAHSTLGRAAAETWVAGSAALLAGCVAAAPRLAQRLADALLGAVGLIAAGSLIYLALVPHGRTGAFQAASPQYPERLRGLEFNPNTLAMLLALGMPIAVAVALDQARSTRVRLLCAALLAIFIAELALTGSRGGLFAGFGASLVVVSLMPGAWRRRVVIGVASCGVLVVAAGGSTIPKALSAAPKKPPAPSTRGINAEAVLPLEGEIGSPYWTHRSGAIHRTLFSTSVRLRALEGAVHRGVERPALGWGYGAETSAFIDRYYGFDSQNPENGYVGIFLQLGVVGLALFLCMLLTCFVSGVRASLRSPSHTSAGIVGAAAAALLLGLSQSYFHGPGGILFVAFWISLLLASVLGLNPGRTQPTA